MYELTGVFFFGIPVLVLVERRFGAVVLDADLEVIVLGDFVDVVIVVIVVILIFVAVAIARNTTNALYLFSCVDLVLVLGERWFGAAVVNVDLEIIVPRDFVVLVLVALAITWNATNTVSSLYVVLLFACWCWMMLVSISVEYIFHSMCFI